MEYAPPARQRRRGHCDPRDHGSRRGRRQFQRRRPPGGSPRARSLRSFGRRRRRPPDTDRPDDASRHAPVSLPTGRVGTRTRRALGSLGSPLLGQRELGIGAVGWDVSSLEFKLIPFGLSPKAVDGRFTAATARALARLQAARALRADGIAGKQTYRALAGATGAGGLHPATSRLVLHGPSGRRLLLDRRPARREPSPARQGERAEAERGDRARARSWCCPPERRSRRPARRARRSRAVSSHDAVRASHRPLVGRLRRRSPARPRDGMDGIGLPVGRRLERGRRRRDAAPPRHVAVGRSGSSAHDDPAHLRRQRESRACDISAGCSIEFDGNRRLALAGYYQGAQSGARPRPLRRHEGVRRDHPEAVRQRLTEGHGPQASVTSGRGVARAAVG